jgi:uncharacterized protein (TIGR03118 family)
MNAHQLLPARARLWVVLAAAVTAAALVGVSSAAERNVYVQHNIVSNVPGLADHVDPNLVNGWGLDAGPGSPWWVADNGTDKSTLYTAGGTINALVVAVPGGPTGLVFNTGSATSFRVTAGGTTARALFLFANEDGEIRGWNPAFGTSAPVGYADGGASYKGLAIAALQSGDRLYAADFKNAKVDMLDANFGLVSNAGTFVDPMLPDGYAPFGIRVLGDPATVFVAYAKQDEEHEDEVAGQGLGFVDAFTTAGAFVGRVATHGQLNAPWGLAMAPDDFGRFSGDLLVGNFGDGEINAYEPLGNGQFEFRGTLRGEDGKPLAIDGLWALNFGHDTTNNGSSKTLFFTAGPNDEEDGLFGSIAAAS